MGLLGDFTAYVDNLKRRGSNTLADLATNPLGLLSRNLSAFSESLPAAPDSVMPSGSGLLNRPGFQQWGMDVALNAPTMGLLGPTVYHGTRNPGAINGLIGRTGGLKMMDGIGPHVGTAEAANERIAKYAGLSPSKAWNAPSDKLDGSYIMPFDLSPQKPFTKSDGSPFTESELQSKLSAIAKKLGYKDTRAYSSAYGASGNMRSAQAAVRDHLLAQGYDAIPYINSHEARGSVSWVVLNPEKLKPLFGD